MGIHFHSVVQADGFTDHADARLTRAAAALEGHGAMRVPLCDPYLTALHCELCGHSCSIQVFTATH